MHSDEAQPIGEIIIAAVELLLTIVADPERGAVTRLIPCNGVVRGTLRERMRRSPLMDGRRFARNMEQAYRLMWRRWCQRPGSS